jgi:hypothetical protein
VGEDVVGGNQVRLAILGGDRGASVGSQELHYGTDALGAGGRRDIAGRLHAEYRDAGGGEVLQQVTVIARHLGHEAGGRKAKPCGHLVGIPFGVGDPRIGVRRKVRVLREDVLRRHVRGELNKKAPLA